MLKTLCATSLCLFTLMFACSLSASAQTQTVPGTTPPPEKPETRPPLTAKPEPKTSLIPYSLSGQATYTLQSLRHFRSKYQGINSFLARNESELSQSYTLFFGARLRPGLEIYVDPELVAGKGLSQSVGLAGFVNGEVIRNPTLSQEPYLARYFVRWTLPTGRNSQSEPLESAPNVVAGTQPVRRIVITAGKLGTNDIFDLNSYADGSRTQFTNWALLNNGAWDYAADTRGYTRGIAVEYITPNGAVRAGSFQMPVVANGIDLANNLAHNHGDQIEVELHPHVLGRAREPLILRLLGYRNTARMGNYRDALALAHTTRTTPDITAVRKIGAVKYGYGLNLEQPLGDRGATGIFARLSWDDGATESFAYTEIDRAVSIGAQISGNHWHRPRDRFAIGYVHNDLAAAHRDYLKAGGLGFLLGDGTLTYGSEQILETYYAIGVARGLTVSLTYQNITNPGYNRDRGPANVAGVRLHGEF